ncbi:hypothetical protein FNV43_RR19137 [Rhamnella rubrinervis]|uniref:ACB domain-containing protein n=1 Tax=Rhamnella rubrinervis TaxID=2594499 RepID=A0A8K0E5Z3_9ROSA|nr:hypothetical protein FNV43_RR19137 [Rhamnella rubrinervis]
MEFFEDFAVTIVLAVVVFYAIFKLSSLVSADDMEDVKTKVGVFECKSGVESGIHGMDSERRAGFVGKVVEVDGFKGKSACEDFITVREFADEKMEFPDESCRSPGLCEGLKTDENEVCGEGLVGCLTEKLIEEESISGQVGLWECESSLVDESSERDKLDELVVDLIKDQVGVTESKDIEVIQCEKDKEGDGAKNKVDVKDEGWFGEDDDWEGIERTELEKLFGAAVVFVGSRINADRISVLRNEVKMKLYGLHMIATQGPCLEPQPMALKVSARAKWNAWQELGGMSPEMAMEQYISLLSESIPKWTQDELDGKHDIPKAEASGKVASFLKTVVRNQPEDEVRVASCTSLAIWRDRVPSECQSSGLESGVKLLYTALRSETEPNFTLSAIPATMADDLGFSEIRTS